MTEMFGAFDHKLTQNSTNQDTNLVIFDVEDL